MMTAAAVPRASWIQVTSSPSWFDWRKSMVNPCALASVAQSFSTSASVSAP